MDTFARRRTSAVVEGVLLAVIVAMLAGLSGLTAATRAGQPGASVATELLEGSLSIRHGDDLVSGRITGHSYFLSTPTGETELVFTGEPPADASNGARVRVRGTGQGKRFLVAAGGTEQVAAPSGTTHVAASTKRIAIVLITFTDNTTQPYTPAHAAGVAFTNPNSVAAYYAETSWGQLTLTGDVFGWYAIPNTDDGCATGTWASSANSVAAAAGVNLSTYDHVVYAFPQASSCGWSGLAQLPGRLSWLNGSGAMGLRVMAHELGHNFGTHHSSTLNCTVNGVRVALATSASSCTASEYGDPFTVMGAASQYHHTNFSRGNFGWLQAANTQTVTTEGDYTLRPIGPYDAGAVQSLRIQRGTNSYITLEFRRPYGTFDTFSTSAPVVNGVSVRLAPGYTTRTQSQLVDTTPTTTSFSDAALPVGSTVQDPLSGVSITTLAVSATGATVRISFGGPTPTPTPTPSPSPTPTPSPNPTPTPTPSPTPSPTPDLEAPTAPSNLTGSLTKKKVTLSWAASTDNVAVVGYRIYRNGVQVGSAAGTGYVDTLPGRPAPTTYTVRAHDAAGNLGPPSNAFAVAP
jgi:hypothetical protein